MRRAILAAALALAAAGCGEPKALVDNCHIGVYRLADGALVDVAPAPGGLRWRLMDGRTGLLAAGSDGGWTSKLGWTGRPDGVAVTFGTCAENRIGFAGQAGQRLSFQTLETRFAGHGGVELAGRLVLPPGAGPAPVAVMVHGSEDTSARDFRIEQRLWPAQGVAVFVYDKRGTGGSNGRYTQDFDILSDDAAAAVGEARRLAGARTGRVGLDGSSQGGWVAPLAASKTPVDFVIARYGLADGPLAEDKGEVLLGLAEKGYGPDVLEKAGRVADATGEIMSSGFKEGFDTLAALRKQYGREPWWKDLEGEFTGQIVHAPGPLVRLVGPHMDKGTSWTYDPMRVLSTLPTPVLWVLAGADREAPPDETRRRLVALAEAGRPVTVIEFPDTDHGIMEFEAAEGGRRMTRYADGYYRAVLDFARDGRLEGAYGAARRLAQPGPRPTP
ncbi:alpha/beta hydrolase [Phenylobacterium sp.]|uniref:alpha/beta hydrolase family protein n=1 Tax=Phenylobacterium sp. TaxID=1871053 RepID=UPI00301C8B0C